MTEPEERTYRCDEAVTVDVAGRKASRAFRGLSYAHQI